MRLYRFLAALCVAWPSLAAEEPKSPLTPEAAQSLFRLAPGLRIDLVAAEPLIESPVACAFDEAGRLWVVEMPDYPNGPPPGQKPQGRIKILEDRDGDGRYETSTVFADNLLFANGVLPWNGGAIVTAAPHIMYLKDTCGDGKADTREILYEGFSAGNPQLRVSSPILGPDGWIYVANGLRGGDVRRAGQPTAPLLPLGGKDFRFDLIRDRAEAIPGMGQFGTTFDRWGHRFVCDNRNHLRHVVFPTDPGQRNPLLVAGPLVEDTAGPADGPLSSGAKIYPISRNWTTSNLHAGRFTAACGIFVEKGGQLPAPYAGGAFTCDPTGNLVHLETLTPHGATYRSTPWKDGIEFLASPDEWFRPVFLTQAPDGALILIDMYRAVIEHPEFMPTELKNRPDLMHGRERGRIWRIAPEDCPPGGTVEHLGRRATPELVKLLGHDNWWHRVTAQRLLLTANDPAVVDALLAYAGETTSPEGLILAAWLLEAKGKLTAEQLKRMIRHNHPRVREHAALILEVSQPNASQFATLAADPDARVRFQTALALGACDEDAVVPLLAKIAAQDTADRWTRIAIAASAGDRTGALLQELFNTPEFVGRPTTDRRQFVQELCELIGSSREAQAAAAVLDMIADHNFRWQQAAITGLAEGFARRGTAFQSLVKQLPQPQRANHLLAAVTQPAVDPALDDAERTAAVRLLAHAPWDTAGLILTQLIEDSDASLSIRLAAIRSLAAHPRPEVAQQLLKNWRSYTPAVRTEVLEALLRQPDRASALLDAVEAGTVRPGDIDPARIRRLLAVKEPTVAARAAKLLRESLPADRKEVLARYREALTQPGDAQRGREVFQKNCAACHAVAGIGVQVGPDISDTRTKTPEMLLTDILNPNAAIDGNYVSYTVTTKDGRTFVGIIVSESASGITLKREQDQTETILRDEIEDIRSSGLSLMPDGVEKTITVSEMADLIRFLKDWRYLDGATPLGK